MTLSTIPEACASADVPGRPFPSMTEQNSESRGTGQHTASTNASMIEPRRTLRKRAGCGYLSDAEGLVKEDPELVELLLALGRYSGEPDSAWERDLCGGDLSTRSATLRRRAAVISGGVPTISPPPTHAFAVARELARRLLEIADAIASGEPPRVARRSEVRASMETDEPNGEGGTFLALDHVRATATRFVNAEWRAIRRTYAGAERTEREDAIQQAWLVLEEAPVDRRPVFLHERQVEHWMRRAARYLRCAARRRAQRALSPVAEDVAAGHLLGEGCLTSVETRLLREEERKVLRLALQLLPVKHLVAILLAEIHHATGVKCDGAARKRAQRGRDALRAIMSELAS